MKKKVMTFVATGMILASMLTACGNIDDGTTNLDTTQANKEATITTGRVTSGVYSTLMEKGKYQTSSARGLSASRLNSNYNLANFQNGLLWLSKETFATDAYYFQEGQKLSSDIIKEWLGRKSDGNPEGMNPKNTKEPIIFQQVEEYDFLSDKSSKISGMSLGIALNSVYYTETSETPISDAALEKAGKEVAQNIISKVRQMEGLADIPIMVALYKQSTNTDVAGGSFILSGTVKKGSKKISSWDSVNEYHLVLPVKSGETNQATKDGLSGKFNDFQETVQGFFPNLSGVSGTAWYVDNKLQTLSLTIETKYFSKTEITSFTQYVGKTAESLLSLSADLEIVISSLEGPQAFLAKNAGDGEMYSHIFN